MDIEERLAAVETAIADLRAAQQGQAPGGDVASQDGAATIPANSGSVIETLRNVGSVDGAVGFGGTVDLPTGEHLEWEWIRPTSTAFDLDDGQVAARLDALGNPVRVRLLRAVLHGAQTTAELIETPGLGTTGQLHHHLRALVAAGWLTSAGRGRYAVPPTRVVPLLVAFLAAGE